MNTCGDSSEVVPSQLLQSCEYPPYMDQYFALHYEKSSISHNSKQRRFDQNFPQLINCIRDQPDIEVAQSIRKMDNGIVSLGDNSMRLSAKNRSNSMSYWMMFFFLKGEILCSGLLNSPRNIQLAPYTNWWPQVVLEIVRWWLCGNATFH